MNNPQKDIYSYAMEHKIGINHSFEFRCDGCGECCKNREDILLNGWDLFKIAKFLNKSHTGEVILEFTEIYIGSDSKLPVCRLKSVGSEKICPFLEESGKCRIHPVKPSVCALFPLGRMYNPKEDKVLYFLQDVDCGSKDQRNKVKDWLSSFNLIEEKEKSKLQWEMQYKMALFTHEEKLKKITQTKQISELLFEFLYLYQTDLDFDVQYKEHLSDLENLIDQII